MSKIKFKDSDEYKDWGYFEKDIKNLKFIDVDIDNIINFYLESILLVNSSKNN